MPVLTPTGIAFHISDLDNEVILRVENRTTDLSRADIWLRDALIEISSDPNFRDEFSELEVLGPKFNLTVGLQEYPETNLMPVGVVNVATLDIVRWADPPTNNLRQKLSWSHYQEADRSQFSVTSLPTNWYRFAGNIGFDPVPDKAYQVQMRALKFHPITDNQLNQTVILLPRDWNEILVWAAAERGFMELLEYEKAQQIHVLLYGDPKYPARPGVINGRKKKREQEAWRESSPLRPVVRTYCSR